MESQLLNLDGQPPLCLEARLVTEVLQSRLRPVKKATRSEPLRLRPEPHPASHASASQTGIVEAVAEATLLAACLHNPVPSTPNPGSRGETLETQRPSEARYDAYYTPQRLLGLYPWPKGQPSHQVQNRGNSQARNRGRPILKSSGEPAETYSHPVGRPQHLSPSKVWWLQVQAGPSTWRQTLASASTSPDTPKLKASLEASPVVNYCRPLPPLCF